jgi:hypothetical protein
MIEEISVVEYMRGMCKAPWDDDKCGMCGGVGMKPTYCCNGSDCGCRGMPVDFLPCNCGADEPTNAMIKSWLTGCIIPQDMSKEG